MSAPLAIVNLGATGNVGAAIKYFGDKKKVGKFLDGLHTGAAVGSPKELAALLLSNHHNPRGKRVARTAVISVKTPRRASKRELEDIDERLMQAFWDLQKVLKVPMLGWTHSNTATRHLHIIFPNSNGIRCLDLRPRWLRQLQGFAWTMALLSGRGKGRRKALPTYPKARKLVVRDLAQVLLDERGNIRQDRWKALVQAGKVTNFRQRKDGSLISFEYGGTGRRVRMATLKGFATECQNTQPVTEELLYEDSPCRLVGGQALEPVGELGRVPAPDRNRPALAPATGPTERTAIPTLAPAKPVALATAVLLASQLEPALTGQPGDNEPASTGTPELDGAGATPLPPGGLAGRGRRFQRRPSQQPAPARPDANATPPAVAQPRFQRPSRPGFGI